MSQVIHARFVEIANELSLMLAEAIASTGPIQLTPRQDAPFSEIFCRAVVGQQLSVKAAEAIWGRVVASADSSCSLVHYFAAADPEILRSCGLSAAKAKSLQAISVATLAGQLDVEDLRQLEYSDRTECLTAIWGVGQWTADMMSIFYFADPDIWPDGDVTARRTLARLTSSRRKTTRTATLFAPHRSYLALYMWRYADAAPVKH